MSLPFNKVIDNPTLEDLLNAFKANIFSSFNCHAIGTVTNFYDGTTTNPKTGPKVDVTINYGITVSVGNSDGTYTQKIVPYPLLINCPLVVLGGGGFNITFPVSAGDQCLILFNDKDLDNWVSGNRSGEVATVRMHSISDGIAIVGPEQMPITNYDTSHAMLRDGTGNVKLGISATKILLNNAANKSLNTLLQTLITDLNTLITQIALITVTPGSLVGPSSPPLNAAAITAVTTSLTTLSTDIGALLE